MSDSKNFKELKVWKRSKDTTKAVYILCSKLPDEEKFGLSSQMKRSSVSIPSNIAEGYRRRNPKEFIHFLGIASGSAAELETQVILVEEIFSIKTTNLQIELVEIQKMISGLINSVKSRIS